MDTHTAEQRHKNMQAIKCKDTKIEILLRKELWLRGIHYRNNAKEVLGKPDIVFKQKRLQFFVTVSSGMDITGKQNEMK